MDRKEDRAELLEQFENLVDKMIKYSTKVSFTEKPDGDVDALVKLDEYGMKCVTEMTRQFHLLMKRV